MEWKKAIDTIAKAQTAIANVAETIGSQGQLPLLIHRIRRGLLNNSVSPGLDQSPLSLIKEQLPVASRSEAEGRSGSSYLRVFLQPEALWFIRKQFGRQDNQTSPLGNCLVCCSLQCFKV